MEHKARYTTQLFSIAAGPVANGDVILSLGYLFGIVLFLYSQV